MFDDLIDYIQERGMSFKQVFMDPNFSNQLYTKVTTNMQNLWAVQNVLGGLNGGEDKKASSFEITAIENSFGTAKHIALNGTPSKVNRLGQKKYRVTGWKTSEFIPFEESDLQNILEAINSASNDDTFREAANAFFKNAQHLRQRVFAGLEQLYWTGIYTGTMTISLEGGTDVDILTGTTVLTPLATTAKWDAPATAVPFTDLDNMAESFLGSGFSGDTIFMNTITYNKFKQCASVKAALTAAETSAISQGIVLVKIGDRRLFIYDATIDATQGATTATKYLPNGYVIMAQMSGLNQAPVRRVNLLNLDGAPGDTVGSNTGEHFMTEIKNGHPTVANLYESYVGVLSFEQPRAYVTLKTF